MSIILNLVPAESLIHVPMKDSRKSLLHEKKMLDTIGKKWQENELDKDQKNAIFKTRSES